MQSVMPRDVIVSVTTMEEGREGRDTDGEVVSAEITSQPAPHVAPVVADRKRKLDPEKNGGGKMMPSLLCRRCVDMINSA